MGIMVYSLLWVVQDLHDSNSCYRSLNFLLLLMIEILHCLKDPKLWELWYIPYYVGSAGFISSTVSRYLGPCGKGEAHAEEAEGNEIRPTEAFQNPLRNIP